MWEKLWMSTTGQLRQLFSPTFGSPATIVEQLRLLSWMLLGEFCSGHRASSTPVARTVTRAVSYGQPQGSTSESPISSSNQVLTRWKSTQRFVITLRTSGSTRAFWIEILKEMSAFSEDERADARSFWIASSRHFCLSSALLWHGTTNPCYRATWKWEVISLFAYIVQRPLDSLNSDGSFCGRASWCDGTTKWTRQTHSNMAEYENTGCRNATQRLRQGYEQCGRLSRT